MKNVTLCIPLYNAESTIARTLESLLNQSHPAKKIKIFDNLSTDKSIEIVRTFMSKNPTIELTVNEKNLGAEGNFTRCIAAAEGDYTALVHSDDIYEKDYIAMSVAGLETHPECVASFCHAREIDAAEKVLGERFYPSELGEQDQTVLNQDLLMKLVFRYGNFITCPSVMVRSNAYSEHIKFWDGERFKSSADLDVWIRLSQIGSLLAIKKPLINYRIAEVSHSFRVAKVRVTRHDLFRVLDYYRPNASDNDYKFLNLKDQALRTLNIVRTKNHELTFPQEVPFELPVILKKMASSKWHLKFGISIIGIKALAIFLNFKGWKKL